MSAPKSASTSAAIVHVNQQAIRQNINRFRAAPAIAVIQDGQKSYGHEVEIVGADGEVVGRFIYSPHKPLLACGARLIFRTVAGKASVRVIDRNAPNASSAAPAKAGDR